MINYNDGWSYTNESDFTIASYQHKDERGAKELYNIFHHEPVSRQL